MNSRSSHFGEMSKNTKIGFVVVIMLIVVAVLVYFFVIKKGPEIKNDLVIEKKPENKNWSSANDGGARGPGGKSDLSIYVKDGKEVGSTTIGTNKDDLPTYIESAKIACQSIPGCVGFTIFLYGNKYMYKPFFMAPTLTSTAPEGTGYMKYYTYQ